MFRKGIFMLALAIGVATGAGAARAAGADNEWMQWGQDAKALATAPLGWQQPDWFWFETGIAITAASSLLDRRLYRQWNGASGAAKFGNAWAFAAPAGAILFYGAHGLFGDDDMAMQKAATYAEAAAFSLAATGLLKVATGRERPVAPGTNHGQFHPGSFNDARTSFPSGHVALAFSAAGVLSAQRDAPWWVMPLAVLGGGVTMFARVRDKRHWASDTVAAALIGFTIGRFVGSRRDGSGFQPMLTSDSVGVQWGRRF
ncbi:MAG: phosphatase PAP2 family protein [Mariprofundaceae bacterium]|nr:phosphatase PAP2 family protein [Mariprofundaceae bacterium]